MYFLLEYTLDIFEVVWSEKVTKALNSLPPHISRKFFLRVRMVDELGIRKTRHVPGYHDEPLQGLRFGQRSVRLNRAYRAIYIQRKDGILEFLEVVEVHKHGY
jgi:proteic killer suppression protein